MKTSGLLLGKAAIVTGAGRGLGLAIAAELAEQGAHVVIAEIEEGAGAAAAESIERSGGSAVSAVTDVRDEDSVAAVTRLCVEKFGAVDVLVNNAGVISPVPIWEMSAGDWSTVLDVHLTGTWLMMREASRPMLAHGGGAIVNVSSIVAKTGGVAQAHYAAAKAGIVGLTKSAAKEWGRHGIRVNAVQPGLFATAQARTMPDSAWERRVAATAMRRPGEPSELATAVLFLASPLASFVTGAVLEVTGGRDI